MEHFKKESKLKIEQKKLETTTTSHQLHNEQNYEIISGIYKHLLCDKIKLTDIAKALNVKALKTVKSWCKRKGLAITKFGRNQYVNLIDFHFELDQPFLDELRVKFPNNWAEMYHAYKTFDRLKIAEQILRPRMKHKFTPQGQAANDFFTKMKRHE
jgi:hypothetical protein